jgi:hypothetical protein
VSCFYSYYVVTGRESTFIPLYLGVELTRRQLQKRFAHHKPPPLPYAQTGQQPGYNPYTNGGNDYSNNPPPPSQPPQSSFQQTNSYGPQTPAATYQPSQANNYRAEQGEQHGYEWEQAREQERLEREAAAGGSGNAPPAYDPTSKYPFVRRRTELMVDMGTNGGNKGYAPPSGAPPK